MRFNVLPCPDDSDASPVVDLTIQAEDGSAYLCAHSTGSSGWLYLLKLDEGGVEFFKNVGNGLGFPIEKDGSLKFIFRIGERYETHKEVVFSQDLEKALGVRFKIASPMFQRMVARGTYIEGMEGHTTVYDPKIGKERGYETIKVR